MNIKEQYKLRTWLILRAFLDILAPMEITYDQGKKFIGHKFRKCLIKMEYRITSKPITLVNPMSDAVLENIQQVLGKLLHTFNISTQTYADKNDPWTGILSAASFVIRSTNNRGMGYIPVQLIFGHDMIILIKHRVDWELIIQQKQTQINKYNTQENKHRVDYDYKVGDKFMLTNHTAYK